MAIDITIIVPVYNVAPYLPDFMTSLAEQSYQGFRVILVDDASTDGSHEIAEYLAEPFGDRATVLHFDENVGLSRNRNRGLDAIASNPTEFLAYLDPDDVFERGYLEDLHHAAIEYGVDIVIAGMKRFEDGTGKILCTEMVDYASDVCTDSSYCDDFAFINPSTCAKLFRFDPIKELRFRDIKRSEDTCYFLEAITRLKTAKFTNNALYYYRIRRTSLSGGMGPDKYHSMHEGFAEFLPLFDGEDLSRYREMVEAQVFIRSSVGGVMRLAFNDLKAAFTLSEQELNWLDSTMPGWRTNKYLSIGRWRSGTSKQLALKISSYLYRAHTFPLFIYLYWFVSTVLKKEVRV